MIRKLQPDEAPPMDLLLLADPSRKIIEAYLTRAECFVMENQNQLIGAYILLPTRPETIELVNIAVQENFQNKGIGKQLIRHALERAKEEGFQTIEVGTGNSSIAQLAFYQKCGFRITGVDKDFFIEHYEEELMENGIPCRDMIRLSKSLR
ncbi:GNAT family N-acetyltransferase [Desemzia sp. C1]|uniref:GNAT family N-acetyltransferase n=1 Tax=Desemzia sp. C1 TaxID=2892016 RepID=UPI001E4B89F7|nr:GNAT family N-acetyltransferase [Desemzia sp. C1]MCI3028240.1 GNAT family N-acetyltransferase [Desemzia sp. C1]